MGKPGNVLVLRTMDGKSYVGALTAYYVLKTSDIGVMNKHWDLRFFYYYFLLTD